MQSKRLLESMICVFFNTELNKAILFLFFFLFIYLLLF